ncbi:hypothetical protein F5B22DRAFT_634895 [Xylaria bambusicola]|uniref:uncharacterized protein n=1 Tax=Xylaria bambusicola TaxID=326684 RepID=UPI0020087351|nr:uncharacterized protein F5B22DRAFT_634895 [Xylaria bambusicola]KAI0521081.1 hypothetical protein F5B22DRAFT_634895 [Xylaria bambusicola]
MSNNAYSDLEVAPGRAPELVPDNGPEVVPSYYYKENDNNVQVSAPEKQGTISVAGGVAGGLASRANYSSSSSNKEANMDISSTSSASPPSSPSSSPTPTTTSAPTISISTVVLPTTILLRDCPSSNDTTYSVSYGDEEPLTFRKYCTAGFRHVLNGVDVVNEPTQSLNDCINACVNYNDKNKTAISTGNNQTCNVVCWRSNEQLDNINQIPGQCFGYTTLNISAGFAVTDEVICDSAAWINQRDL